MDNLDFFSFPIKAHNDSTGAVLFDASSFILKENRFFPVIAKNVGSYTVNSSLKENLTRVTKLKVFDENACVGMIGITSLVSLVRKVRLSPTIP